MDHWRDPTQEETQVISKQATKEIFFTVLTSLLFTVLFLLPMFVTTYKNIHKGYWLGVILGSLFFIGFAALIVGSLFFEARLFFRVRRLDYQVFIGVCGKKWKTGRRSQDYHLQVNLGDEQSYSVETSASTYKKVDCGSSILVSNHKRSSISDAGMWGHLYN